MERTAVAVWTISPELAISKFGICGTTGAILRRGASHKTGIDSDGGEI